MTSLKLTTKRACRAIGFHRDRFNEHVAGGHFLCAPQTIPGRARLFDQHDMLALVLFKMIMGNGLPADRAGPLACVVADAAKNHPDETVIAYVQNIIGMDFHGIGRALPYNELLAIDQWETGDTKMHPMGTVQLFHVAELRRRAIELIEEEASIIGED